jgi:hypothetical protein
MSVYELRAYLDKGLPPGIKLSGTAVAVLQIILFRYDTREGKKSAYPGMAEFMRAIPKSRSTIQDALKELLEKGLIIQIQKGYRNFRAEYVPTFIFRNYGLESVGVPDTNEIVAVEDVSPLPVISDATTVVKSPVISEKVSGLPDVLNTLNTLHTSKYVSKVNVERWNVVISEIPKNLHRYIKTGGNYEKLLDQCEANGMTPNEIRRAIGERNYENAYKVGGLLNDVLQGLAGIKRASKSKSRLEHCGNSFCDPVTRTFPEASEVNGRMDHRCNKCNEELVEETKRLHSRTSFDLGDFGKFGSLPDDV